jgi:hypothetical protein
MTLRKLRRLDEARQEIRRAIECDEPFGHAAEPWKAWAILAGIETDAGNPAAAASLLEQRAADPDAAWLRPLVEALQAIVAGSRDPALAADPGLDYTMAAEILFLLETLGRPR